MTRDELNPYATPSPVPGDAGQDARAASGRPLRMLPPQGHRVRGGFLYRVLDFDEPLGGRLTYTGWWFVQRVYWNHRLVWRAVSWWTLRREIAFPFPPGSVTEGIAGRIAIRFGPGLRIRDFTVWGDGHLLYHEGRHPAGEAGEDAATPGASASPPTEPL